jgi:hypothetical protein
MLARTMGIKNSKMLANEHVTELLANLGNHDNVKTLKELDTTMGPAPAKQRKAPPPRELWLVQQTIIRPMMGPGRGHASLLMSQ